MKKILLIAAAVLIVGYGLFEARRLLEGPRISIDFPRDGSATSSAAVLVGGTAENISFLTINDKPAYTDETGHFEHLFAPAPGYTVITVAATDRFGRRASKSVAINVLTYCPLENHG